MNTSLHARIEKLEQEMNIRFSNSAPDYQSVPGVTHPSRSKFVAPLVNQLKSFSSENGKSLKNVFNTREIYSSENSRNDTMKVTEMVTEIMDDDSMAGKPVYMKQPKRPTNTSYRDYRFNSIASELSGKEGT